MIISILGCGWLGLPLAKHLIARSHTIKGSTTSSEKLEQLEENNIQPFVVKLTPVLENRDHIGSFWDSQVLVLNIPPGRKRDNVIDFHTRQIRSITNAITDSSIKFVVFVSSTSVYPNLPGAVAETDVISGKARRDSGNALLKAEEMLMENTSFETTVLRFGGLMGYGRHPAKYLAGKKDLKRANAPVNRIHRDDCIAIITQIIEEQITGEVFNAVSDAHPTRQEHYIKAAKKLGLEPPTFEGDNEESYKLVKNDKLKSRLEYKFS